ncbi:uncharacterized protein LOC144129994 [Amblyomma americanum]
MCHNLDLSNPAVLSPLIAVCICRARTASWHCREDICPQDVQALCGWLRPSTGHTKRVCKILRSEWMRQARFLKDVLWSRCASGTPLQNQRVFRYWCRTTDQLTEFLWNVVRSSLPKAKRRSYAGGKLLVLGDIAVDPRHAQTLRLGPKFCLESGMMTVERLELARDVSYKAPAADRTKCESDCIDAVSRCVSSKGKYNQFRSLVDYLYDNRLRTVQSDKEGFFVVMSEDQFSEKAHGAVMKNFKSVTRNPVLSKKRAVTLLRKFELEERLLHTSGEVPMEGIQDEHAWTPQECARSPIPDDIDPTHQGASSI